VDPTGHNKEDRDAGSYADGGESEPTPGPCDGKGPDLATCLVLPDSGSIVSYQDGSIKFFDVNGAEYTPSSVGEMEYEEGWVDFTGGLRHVTAAWIGYLLTRSVSAGKMQIEESYGLPEGEALHPYEEAGVTVILSYYVDKAIPAPPPAGTTILVFERPTPSGNAERIRITVSPNGGLDAGDGWWLMYYEP